MREGWWTPAPAPAPPSMVASLQGLVDDPWSTIPAALLAILFVQWNIMLLNSLRTRTAVVSHVNSWRTLPMGVMTILLGFFTFADDPAAHEPLVVPKDTIMRYVLTMPISGFALLLVSEVLSWVFMCVGPKQMQRFRYLRIPVMAVHCVSLLFYVIDDVYGGPYVMSVFGRPVSALRSLMWNFSVSCMGINMSFVCESILEAEGHTRPSDEQAISVRASLTEYLIATQVTRGWPVDGQL